MKKLFPAVQKLGRSLMLPIAVLPVAGLLLRLGQPDLLDLPYVAAAGNAVFANLGMLFAIGVAVGLARGNNGAAGLAAVVALPGDDRGRQGSGGCAADRNWWALPRTVCRSARG